MAKGKALPPFPRICCALSLSLSLSLFRCVLFLFMTRVMIKNTREKKTLLREGRENFLFFTRLLARRIKSRRRDIWNWSDFLVQLFLPKKRDKKETEFFSKQKLHSFLHLLLLIIINILFCGVSLPRSEDHREESFRECCCFLKTQREKEREKCVYFFF